MPSPSRSDSWRRLLDGPPFALPATLDRVAEWWARAGPRLRALVVVALVVVVLVVAGRGAARSPWGPARPVLVARTELAAGHVLEESDVMIKRWPERVGPDAAPTAVDQVVGKPLAATVPAGTAVSDAHVGDGGLARQLMEGEVALALPLPDGTDVNAGQRLDVLAGDGSGGGVRVANGARVLVVHDVVVWVAVAREEAAGVAGAVHWGQVNLALLPE